jgi:hypothetical protein
MTADHANRDMYRRIPRNDLTVHGVTRDSFVDGPLEDWIPGAMKFDGKSTYGSLSHEAMAGSYTYRSGRTGPTTVPATSRKSADMDTNSFLIEAYFRTQPEHTSGVLASKRSADGPGYELRLSNAGTLQMYLPSTGPGLEVTEESRHVNDGKWHHVLVEVQRTNGGTDIRMHLDGELIFQSPPVMQIGIGSLSNAADLLFGKGPNGNHFAGEIEFLRIARGTLADARTTIDELYAWQFQTGPFLRDFTGREIADGKRDAGAIEAAPTSAAR